MLNKILMRAAFTAAALTVTAGASSAENYRVLMMDYAFFPDISYVQDGDTLTFVNMSGITRTIASRDGSWTTPELIDGAEATITVEKGMFNSYQTRIDGVGGAGVIANSTGTGDNVTDVTDGSTGIDGQDAEEGTIIGKINFAETPAIQTN